MSKAFKRISESLLEAIWLANKIDREDLLLKIRDRIEFGSYSFTSDNYDDDEYVRDCDLSLLIDALCENIKDFDLLLDGKAKIVPITVESILSEEQAKEDKKQKKAKK